MDAIRRSELVLNHEDTELRLGLPGNIEGVSEKQQTPQGSKKRASPGSSMDSNSDMASDPPPKAQVVGWPPVRSYRRNCFQPDLTKKSEEGMYVKVSMDGAPYLRKIDIKLYKGYQELLMALEEMFKFKAGSYSEKEGYIRGSEFEPAYEDKDGDWMLVGDVPWEMFMSSCKRLRIMKGSAN